MFVQTVSILCACLSFSADVVQFVFAHVSADGRLVADGAGAPSVAVLQRRCNRVQTQTASCVMMYPVHVVVTLLPNMLIESHSLFFLF